MKKQLTFEAAHSIKNGDVVMFTYNIDNSPSITEIGVVYDRDSVGIKCHREDASYFVVGRGLYDSHVEFEVLEDYAPVAIYNGEYYFVNNHP